MEPGTSGHHGVCVHLHVVVATVTVSVPANHPIMEENHALGPENRPNSATLPSALVSVIDSFNTRWRCRPQSVHALQHKMEGHSVFFFLFTLLEHGLSGFALFF